MDNQIVDLRRLVERQQAIFMVGSGISFGATDDPCANWRGLLLNGADRCLSSFVPKLGEDWIERKRKQIECGDVEELVSVAGEIASRLGGPSGMQFRNWLRDSVGGLKPVHPSVIESICGYDLPIMTTNFDRLFEVTDGKRQSVTWKEANSWPSNIRDSSNWIFHMHGVFDYPESVILGPESYQQLMQSDAYQTMLRSVAAMKSIIFIGFGSGLNDPSFRRLLPWLGTVFGDSILHYRLALQHQVSEFEFEHREHPVNVVSYGESHDQLVSFLSQLRTSESNLPSWPGIQLPSDITQSSPASTVTIDQSLQPVQYRCQLEVPSGRI